MPIRAGRDFAAQLIGNALGVLVNQFPAIPHAIMVAEEK
jgi:hypothetical protein